MHLKPYCVGIPEKAIFALMELSQNLLLTFCNTCVKNNQKDKILYKISINQDSVGADTFTGKVKPFMESVEGKREVKLSSQLSCEIKE